MEREITRKRDIERGREMREKKRDIGREDEVERKIERRD